MNIINLYNDLKDSYKSYLESFVSIKDRRIEEKVNNAITSRSLLPLWDSCVLTSNNQVK